MKSKKIRTWLTAACTALVLPAACIAIPGGEEAAQKSAAKDADKGVPDSPPKVWPKAADQGPTNPPRAGVVQLPTPQLQDPRAVNKATETVTKRREELSVLITKVQARMVQSDHLPLDLKAENGTLELYRDKIIPALRAWRDDILKDKAMLMTGQSDFIVALEKLIETLRADEQRGADPKIRSQQIRELLNKLRAEEGNLAVKYLDRLKRAQELAAGVQEFLTFVEDSGSLLDQWEGVVVAMLEAGDRGENALKKIEGLREFAKAFQEGLEQFFRFTDSLGSESPGGGSSGPNPKNSQPTKKAAKPQA